MLIRFVRFALVLSGLTSLPWIVSGQTAAASGSARQATFTKDVAPILERACQRCHRPGNIAPMSLLTYKDARPWARAIKQQVALRNMPPWFVDRNVGIRKFKDDPSLSDAEIATISAWADSGALEGNPADMPPPVQFENESKWHIGKPDLIVPIPVPFTMKAHGSDWWGNLVSDSGLTEDRYIKAVETKPTPGGGVRVLHHSVQSLVDEDGVSDSGTLNEYAVGKNGDIYPEDAGKLMKAGSRIQFNMHYHAVGQEITDRTTIGFVFYPKGYTPKHVIQTVQVGSTDLDIPPGESNVRSDGYFRFEKPGKITGFMPHMHNRGKAECIEVIYPNAAVETLNCVSRFNFGWQIVYNYADDAAPLLPAGSVLHVINWHDNSKNNSWNPDPRNWVGYGERTNDEMSKSWVNFYYMSEEEYQAEVTARKARTTSSKVASLR